MRPSSLPLCRRGRTYRRQILKRGWMLYERGDYATALRELRPLADQGHFGAQAFLGQMYYYGQGIDLDFREAASWYRQAAEQGLAKAQFLLGNMYRERKGRCPGLREGRVLVA